MTTRHFQFLQFMILKHTNGQWNLLHEVMHCTFASDVLVPIRAKARLISQIPLSPPGTKSHKSHVWSMGVHAHYSIFINREELNREELLRRDRFHSKKSSLNLNK